jgi:biotin carboxylase
MGDSHPVFLVFEPTNHIYQVAEAAERRGCDVFVFHSIPLVSSGPYAPCVKAIANSYLVDSWLDIEANLAQVTEACAGRRVVGTYAAQEVVLELEARVQEHFGLPGKGSAVVREMLNKVNVRRRLQEAGLTRLRLFEHADFDEWPVGDRALYFKPVHGAGSAYVKRCANLAELRSAVDEWNSADKASIPVLGPYLERDGGAFFLDEEAVGELMSIEGYVYQGRYVPYGLHSRTVLVRDIAVEMGISYPYDHPRYDDIVAAAERFHEALGITHGPTHLELIVGEPGGSAEPGQHGEQGDIELVEMNLRFAGADALAGMNLVYGERIEDDLVSLAIGEDTRSRRQPQRYACSQFLLAPRGLTRIDSLEVPVSPDVPFVKVIRPPGSVLTSTDRQIDWIATYIACGPTFDEAWRTAVETRRATLVNGEPLGDDPNNVVVGR